MEQQGTLTGACPACKSPIRFQALDAGQTMTCPSCGAVVTPQQQRPTDSQPPPASQRPRQMMRFHCPQCREVLNGPLDLAGQTRNCPHCKQPIQIPIPGPEAGHRHPQPAAGPAAYQEPPMPAGPLYQATVTKDDGDQVTYKCPHCRARLRNHSSIRGRRDKCPACGAVIFIPAETITYRCPDCKVVLESLASLGGQKDRCPHCGALCDVPMTHRQKVEQKRRLEEDRKRQADETNRRQREERERVTAEEAAAAYKARPAPPAAQDDRGEVVLIPLDDDEVVLIPVDDGDATSASAGCETAPAGDDEVELIPLTPQARGDTRARPAAAWSALGGAFSAAAAPLRRVNPVWLVAGGGGALVLIAAAAAGYLVFFRPDHFPDGGGGLLGPPTLTSIAGHWSQARTPEERRKIPACMETDMDVALSGSSADVVQISTQYVWGSRLLDTRAEYRFAVEQEAPGIYLLSQMTDGQGGSAKQQVRWILSTESRTLTAIGLGATGEQVGQPNVFNYVDARTRPF